MSDGADGFIGLAESVMRLPARLCSMTRWVGRLLLWLLVLALPVQGFAASTMLFCGAGHQGMVAAAAGGHDHASHMHSGRAQNVAEMAESPADEPAAGTASSSKDSVLEAVSTGHGKVVGKCSACASCCSVACLPAALIAFTAPAPSRALPVVELTTHVGFFTDGPDRPPRLPLA